MAYGRTVFSQNSVFPTRVSADGSPKYKAGGGTIDWGTVAAPGSDVTLPDGSIVKSGTKYLRHGQVVCRIDAGTSAHTQTITGGATSGNFTITLVRPDTGASVTTANIAFNASAATILAAIQAVLGPGQAASSSGGPLNTTPVPVVFGTAMTTMVINNGTLAGGTVTVAVTNAGATTGYFGPYDPAASDGRQNLDRGECYILDETVLQYSAGGAAFGVSNDQVGSLIEGGDVFIDRVLHSGAATHTLAAGPTLAEITTAFPRVSFVKD
jgi:hypothetical protein